MIASLKGYGRIARALLAALGALLVLGIIGSLLMGVHARHSARDQIVHQAQTIADSSLTLAFTPADLTGPVSAERASQLTAQIQAIVIDPSDFDSVTLYSPEGTILYSTATSRIGTQLPGEKDSIKEALRGVPLTSEFDGTLALPELRRGILAEHHRAEEVGRVEVVPARAAVLEVQPVGVSVLEHDAARPEREVDERDVDLLGP